MNLPYGFLLGLALCLYSSTLVASQAQPALAVVHVPLTASSDNQRYFANVNMSHGPQTQRFGFALSTTTGYTIVADTSCASCASNNIPTYNSSLSDSAKAIDSGQQQQQPVVNIAGGAVNAGTGLPSKEDCALRQANGSFWQYPNQTIIQANASTIFQAGVSGLIGLGTNTADFGDTVFAGWLSSNPTISNFTFGLALNPLSGTQAQVPVSSSGGDPDDAGANAGTLHMQSADPSSYTGDIQWQQVPDSVAATNGSSNSSGMAVGTLGDSSWLIQMDGWNFMTPGAQTSNSQGGLAAVEPFFANIFLPKAHVTQLYAAVPGSQPLPTDSSDPGQSYSIPCNADITFTAILSGQGYVVPKEALVIKGTNGSCTGAIEGWKDGTATNYLLGSRFISTVYMVFQVGQPPAMQQKVGIAQRAGKNTTKKKPVGAIVGGVIGGVAFLLIVSGAMFWWIRRKRRMVASSNAKAGVQESESLEEKIASPAISGHSINHWAPASGAGTTFEPYYTSVSSPAPINSPNSAHSTTFSHTVQSSSPPGTAASETFLLSHPPAVKQWVTGMHPTGPNHQSPTRAVPTAYDYGNDGEPGTPFSPVFSDEHVGSGLLISQDSHGSSTQVDRN